MDKQFAKKRLLEFQTDTNPREVKAEIESLSKSNTTSIVALMIEAAEKYFDAGKYAESLEICRAFEFENLGSDHQVQHLKLKVVSNLIRTNQQDEALKELLALKERVAAYPELKARWNTESGLLYYNRSEYAKSIEHSLKAIELGEELKAYSIMAPAAFNLGRAYHHLYEWDLSLKFSKEAVEFAQKAGLSNKAIYYKTGIANALIDMKQFAEAEKEFHSALKMSREVGNQYIESVVLSNLASMANDMNEPQKIIEYASQALELKKLVDDDLGIAIQHHLLAEGYSQVGEYAAALSHIRNAMEAYTRQNAPQKQAKAFESLYQIHKRGGNFEEALQSFEKLQDLKDELFSQDKRRSIEELQTKYETAEKDREAQQLRLDKVEAELKALRAQMNPHFFFNAMNSIAAMIKPESTEEAKSFLKRFSRLMRKSLEHAEQPTIPLKDEIQFLEDYLTLEKLRMSVHLSFKFHYDEELDLDFIEIPTMLLQPYIENSIKHGIAQSESPGKIDLHFEELDDQLICTIRDNGIGRKKAAEAKAKRQELLGEKHESKAMSITASRINLIKQQTDRTVIVNLKDLDEKIDNTTGLEVQIVIDL